MHAQADLLPINHLTGLTDLCLELPGGTHLPDLDLSRHALQILHIFCGGPLEWNHGQMDDEFDPIHVSPSAHKNSTFAWLLVWYTMQ